MRDDDGAALSDRPSFFSEALKQTGLYQNAMVAARCTRRSSNRPGIMSPRAPRGQSSAFPSDSSYTPSLIGAA